MKAIIKGHCKDCKFFMNNFVKEELDATDYEDVVCTYHMADGFTSNDYCSKFEEKEQKVKAILVIDMPKKCDECKFYDGCECFATGEKIFEGTIFKVVEDWNIRESWCPLKPMPDKLDWKVGYVKDKNTCTIFNKNYVDGYNECIDEILGK